MNKLKIIAATLALATLTVLSNPLPASSAPAGEHLVVTVGAVQADGNFEILSVQRFSTYAEVLKSRGLKNVSPSASPANTTQQMIAITSTIGVHYDGAGGSGSSFSVVGSDCSGGGLNLPLIWDNRVSSTWNGCPNIVHYNWRNYTGATFTTSGVGTIDDITGGMNNQTSSIKYFN